jgi:hypothetical protein
VECSGEYAILAGGMLSASSSPVRTVSQVDTPATAVISTADSSNNSTLPDNQYAKVQLRQSRLQVRWSQQLQPRHSPATLRRAYQAKPRIGSSSRQQAGRYRLAGSKLLAAVSRRRAEQAAAAGSQSLTMNLCQSQKDTGDTGPQTGGPAGWTSAPARLERPDV